MKSSYQKLAELRNETIFNIKLAMKEIDRIQEEYREKDKNLENLAYRFLLGDLMKELQKLYEIE